MSANIVSGMDLEKLEAFRTALHSACNEKGAYVLLDCKELSYMNSKSFGALSQHHRTCLATMGRLALCNLNRKLVKTMDLLGLGQQLSIFDTRDDALAQLK